MSSRNTGSKFSKGVYKDAYQKKKSQYQNHYVKELMR